MEFADIAIVSGFVIVYALVSRRIETTPITGPIVFVAVGIMLGTSGFDLLGVYRGEVVLEDAGWGCPAECSVGSVVIVEMHEPGVGAGPLGF